MTGRRGTRLESASVRFTFDGRAFVGQRGDTLASALWAAGVRVFGRSVKYGRARGLLALGPEEPCALVTVLDGQRRLPNVPAGQLPLYEGLEAHSQNAPHGRWRDLRRWLRPVHGLLGAGFYYKTFLWPSWRWHEGRIRALAGLGEAPGSALLEPTLVHDHCDVLIAGAGPAGLQAALLLARLGLRVTLCEREGLCGGELGFEDARIEGMAATQWITRTLGELRERGAQLRLRTALLAGTGQFVAHERPELPLDPRHVLHKIRARALLVATGAAEQPLAFVDNDRPGVMLLGSAERLLAEHGVTPGASVVLAGSHDRLYAAARRLMRGGVGVRAIVDARAAAWIDAGAGAARAQLRARGVECLAQYQVLAALGRSRGDERLAAVSVAPGGRRGEARTLHADALLVSGGWAPTLAPLTQGGGAPSFDARLGAALAVQQPGWRVATGAAAGHLSLTEALRDAASAAARIAALFDIPAVRPTTLVEDADGEPRWAPHWRAPSAASEEKRQFVDLQNDVTVADLRQALTEGYEDIEHVKRYTTLGYGTEQARHATALATAVVAELRAVPPGEVMPWRARAPFEPVPIGAIAAQRHGMGLRAARETPLQAEHEASGALLEPSGLWWRPRCYPRGHATPGAAARAEALRVRHQGGVMDASTLGKIELCGPQAAHLLDRVLLAPASRLATGAARYGVSLREDGMVLDDGILLRLAPERFLLSTSTGRTALMLSHLEFHRAQLGLAASVVDVTDAWAVIVVAGPQSRQALAELFGEQAARVASLPYMRVLQCQHAGRALRLLRASYSGELAYEVHCHPQAAPALWAALAPRLPPYGLEALDILRIEKGYLGHGEINGQTTPMDLNLQHLLAAENPCIGRELLARAAFAAPERPRLVGIRSTDDEEVIAGAQLTRRADERRPCGYVTSSAYSPMLERWVGLALVARSEALGARLFQRDPLRARQGTVELTDPVHFDSSGARMRA